jgi:hypothetical protein
MMGELERFGGVIAPGLCDGDRAGESASLTLGIGPNMRVSRSSSDGVLISTSLSNEDRKDGVASAVDADTADGRDRLDCPASPAAEDDSPA